MANNNCKCKRIIGPSGIWTIDELVGATVKIGSMPISNFNTFAIDSDKTFEVESVDFRISLDGKAITVVKLKGLEGQIFTLKDLIFTGILLKEEDKEEEVQ